MLIMQKQVGKVSFPVVVVVVAFFKKKKKSCNKLNLFQNSLGQWRFVE